MSSILLLLLICIPPGYPLTKATVRDQQGRIVQQITPRASSSQLVIRDSRGRLSGTITIKGTSAVVRDSQGRIK